MTIETWIKKKLPEGWDAREYQTNAISAINMWMRNIFTEHSKYIGNRACVEAATGSGKAMICALAALKALTYWKRLHMRVLVTVPTQDLVRQNYNTAKLFGVDATIFSGSIDKDPTGDMVICTPQTLNNYLKKFYDKPDDKSSKFHGSRWSLMLNDEAHGTTPTIRRIVDYLEASNNRLRVLGLTATPYRLNEGYIYQQDMEGHEVVGADTALYHHLIFRITALELVRAGYLARPVVGSDPSIGYDTTSLKSKGGEFTQSDIDELISRQDEKLPQIVADIVVQTAARNRVMVFASSIRHAHHIQAMLPHSRVATGDMKTAERVKFVQDLKKGYFKYAINVALFTTGFDDPEIDAIAVVRPSDSAALFQQIIGRGLRKHPSKQDCLVLDYAGNIERLTLIDDEQTPLKPKVDEGEKYKKLGGLAVLCPCCWKTHGSPVVSDSALTDFARCSNELEGMRIQWKVSNDPSLADKIAELEKLHLGNPLYPMVRMSNVDDTVERDRWGIDQFGYLCDLTGERVTSDKGEPICAITAHACVRKFMVKGELKQCDHLWQYKTCPECEKKNRISARVCAYCGEELTDAEENLDVEAFQYAQARKQGYKLIDNITTIDQRGYGAGAVKFKIDKFYSTVCTVKSDIWRKLATLLGLPVTCTRNQMKLALGRLPEKTLKYKGKFNDEGQIHIYEIARNK